MVINLPPDKNGKLVETDVKNLMYIADKLSIKRKIDQQNILLKKSRKLSTNKENKKKEGMV